MGAPCLLAGAPDEPKSAIMELKVADSKGRSRWRWVLVPMQVIVAVVVVAVPGVGTCCCHGLQWRGREAQEALANYIVTPPSNRTLA